MENKLNSRKTGKLMLSLYTENILNIVQMFII